jgi:hypothetical protein
VTTAKLENKATNIESIGRDTTKPRRTPAASARTFTSDGKKETVKTEREASLSRRRAKRRSEIKTVTEIAIEIDIIRAETGIDIEIERSTIAASDTTEMTAASVTIETVQKDGTAAKWQS